MISSFPVKQLIFKMNSKQIAAMSRSSSRHPRIYPDRSDASDDPPPSPSLFLRSPPKNGRQLHLASILLSLLHSILTQSLHIWKLTRFASGIATILGKLPKKKRFFLEIFPKCGWVGWLFPKQGPNPSKPPKFTPKIDFFDRNFTFWVGG